MAHISGFNFNRLKWCCEDLGVTLEECASATNISINKLRAVDQDTPKLTFNQIRKLAQYCSRSILFFLGNEPIADSEAHSPQFRTIATQAPKISRTIRIIIERVEEYRARYLALNEELEEDIPSFNPPKDLINQSIPEKANAIRSWLKLNNLKTFTEYRTKVEQSGCLVFKSTGYQGDWKIAKNSEILGFSWYDETTPVIFVTKQDSEARQTFTLFHELSHLILHTSSHVDLNEPRERSVSQETEANLLASHILVPADYLQKINIKNMPSDTRGLGGWLRPFSDELGVSTDVILLRLIARFELDERLYQDYVSWRNQTQRPAALRGTRKYRHREPLHIFGRPYVNTVLTALINNHITPNKACGYLDNINLKDVRKLEDYCVTHP